MIKLTDIRKTGDSITAKAYVEDSREPVELTYSIAEHAFAAYRLPRGYEYCTAHIEQARRFFEQTQDGTLPETRTIMWY